MIPDEAAAIKGFTTFFWTTSMNSRSSAWQHERPELRRTKRLWKGFPF